MSDDRPPVYYEHDTLIIRASAIGNTCLFDLVAAGQGHEPSRLPENLQRAFKQGHELEPVIVKRLKETYHIHFLSHQEEGDLVIIPPSVIVRYHPDGIANLGTTFMLLNARIAQELLLKRMQVRTVVVEVKALSDVLWQKFVKGGMGSVIDEYAWQLSVMMIDTGYPGLWVGYNKGFPPGEDGVKPECADEGRLHFELVLEPPISEDEIRAKAGKIKELVDGEDLLTSGQACGDPNHWPCRYLHLRPENGSEESGDIQTVPDEHWDAVNELVKQYLYHKGQEDEHKARREVARDELIRLAEGRKVKLKTNKWIVPVYEGSGARTYDWKSMPEGLRTELKRFEKAGKKYLYIKGPQRLD